MNQQQYQYQTTHFTVYARTDNNEYTFLNRVNMAQPPRVGAIVEMQERYAENFVARTTAPTQFRIDAIQMGIDEFGDKQPQILMTKI